MAWAKRKPEVKPLGLKEIPLVRKPFEQALYCMFFRPCIAACKEIIDSHKSTA